MNPPKVRCCNLDWLEVYVLEPFDVCLNADFYMAQGYTVHVREYGTRVYQEMFVICGDDNKPFLEVRRNPFSAGEASSVLQVNSCHLRLVNRACYYDNAAEILLQFIQKYGYMFKRIARLDVCLDFERFDSGDYPQFFIQRYLKGKFAKINQGRIRVYGNELSDGHNASGYARSYHGKVIVQDVMTVRLFGDDKWAGQLWNSVSWGSKSSMVSTKLYNKTLELREGTDKPYIKQAWFLAGLVDHPIDLYKVNAKGEIYYPEIWRLEFSIKSARNGWYTVEEDGNGRKLHSYPHDLSQWLTRGQCLEKFMSLVPHYFRFKHFIKGQRKDRCPDKILFDLKNLNNVYHLNKTSIASTSAKNTSFVERLVKMLVSYRETHQLSDIKSNLDNLINYLNREIMIHNMNVTDALQARVLQIVLELKLKGDKTDPNRLIDQIKAIIENQKSNNELCF